MPMTREEMFEKEGIATEGELQAIARELLNDLRPRKLQIWQIREILSLAAKLVDRERLK